MEANGTAALSEVLERLREVDGQKITKKEFETALMKYFSGSHAYQQIAQLWNKAHHKYNLDLSYTLCHLCRCVKKEPKPLDRMRCVHFF